MSLPPAAACTSIAPNAQCWAGLSGVAVQLLAGGVSHGGVWWMAVHGCHSIFLSLSLSVCVCMFVCVCVCVMVWMYAFVFPSMFCECICLGLCE